MPGYCPPMAQTGPGISVAPGRQDVPSPGISPAVPGPREALSPATVPSGRPLPVPPVASRTSDMTCVLPGSSGCNVDLASLLVPSSAARTTPNGGGLSGRLVQTASRRSHGPTAPAAIVAAAVRGECAQIARRRLRGLMLMCRLRRPLAAWRPLVLAGIFQLWRTVTDCGARQERMDGGVQTGWLDSVDT